MKATRLTLRLSDDILLFQRGEFLTRVLLDGGNASFDERSLRQENLEESLKPFYGFDHLTAVSLPGCEPFALGVGLYNVPRPDVRVPRRLQRLAFTNDGFLVMEILAGLEVTTFSAVTREASGDVIVGLFGEKNGQSILHLVQSKDCGRSFDALSTNEIEFSWRTVTSPFGYDAPRLEMHDGVKLVGERSSNGGVRFVHYDGFDLRQFELHPPNWALTQTRTTLHEERHDLSW